ncbi:hypothetical protein [Pseudonocardia charpentierae]|uniref:Uncharacterized protein n=1 Tax=Pseudonocardia charpentierae TaxID=3075545 RepID=A0ABU2NGU6_9PSEU|nr:hypothetical protein [Pseudonocardia sp. DSM 45834]MDT0351819.1 hypothetical protein [Pseudonocardia sp. DSM 45834]
MSFPVHFPEPARAGQTRAPSCGAAGPGEAASGFDRGDFVLVAGTHLNSCLIRFGQKLRIRGADDLAKYFYSDAQAGAGEADSTVRTSSARERIPSLR